MSFIADKLRSHEAELTGRVRAMQAKRYNSWKASLYTALRIWPIPAKCTEQHHPFLLYGQLNDATDTLHVIYVVSGALS